MDFLCNLLTYIFLYLWGIFTIIFFIFLCLLAILSVFTFSVCFLLTDISWKYINPYSCDTSDMLRDTPVCPTGGGTGSQQTILHEEQWKMPALPALLLSIYIAVSLLTMAPLSFSQVNTLSAVRMGKSSQTHQVSYYKYFFFKAKTSLLTKNVIIISKIFLQAKSYYCKITIISGV